jgi:host factor-I protein
VVSFVCSNLEVPHRDRKKQMDKLAQNIQEAFLNNARRDKTFLTIYLMSGVKLSGRIRSFDKYSVVLEANNQEQLIFKHAISTIVISKSSGASQISGIQSTPGSPLIDSDAPENTR